MGLSQRPSYPVCILSPKLPISKETIDHDGKYCDIKLGSSWYSAMGVAPGGKGVTNPHCLAPIGQESSNPLHGLSGHTARCPYYG